MRRILISLFIAFCLLPVCVRGERLVFFTDALAARDDYGLLHQSPSLNPTDLAPRYPLRSDYYLISSQTLSADPAYVGALQTVLHRRGYYCGPIDGVFSPAVSAAVAHMQKNYSQQVTGTLTIGVRRALCLP